MLKMGSGAKANSVSHGLMRQHEDQRARGEHDGVGGVHDRRADQHANGVQIVGGARHDVAGARALIKAVGEPLQMSEEVVAQIEFDFARNADQNPARQELEDGFNAGNPQQHQSVGEQLLAGDAAIQIVDGAADDQRKQNPDAVVKQHADRAEPERRLVLAQIRKQRAEVFEHQQ